jgi:hypothetical protein
MFEIERSASPLVPGAFRMSRGGNRRGRHGRGRLARCLRLELEAERDLGRHGLAVALSGLEAQLFGRRDGRLIELVARRFGDRDVGDLSAVVEREHERDVSALAAL